MSENNDLVMTEFGLMPKVVQVRGDGRGELLDFARRVVVWMRHVQTGGALDFADVEKQAREVIAEATHAEKESPAPPGEEFQEMIRKAPGGDPPVPFKGYA